MVKMALPPTMAVVAEATMPLAMLLEERADKMDMVALAEEKDGFPSFKTQQGNLQRPMAEMGAMAVAVVVAQAAAAIPCMQLELEEAIQGGGAGGTTYYYGGGGGGSYNSGSNISSSGGFQNGNGQVVITW